MTVRREIVESRCETGKHSREGLSGEQAGRQACRSSESAIAAEAFMNNTGYNTAPCPTSQSLRHP
jgi:hypothetical protein